MPSGTAVTDSGNEVGLWEAELGRRPEEGLQAAEEQRLRSRGIFGRLIRVAPASRSYNCHGWVFTGGRYLLPDFAVGPILRDNGYRAVEEPAVGDLAAYRDGSGAIHHTALVWGKGEDGRVLLESKWGWMGRYLHPPEVTIYGQEWTYYRSARQGHVLRGLSSRPPGPGPRSAVRRGGAVAGTVGAAGSAAPSPGMLGPVWLPQTAGSVRVHGVLHGQAGDCSPPPQRGSGGRRHGA